MRQRCACVRERERERAYVLTGGGERERGGEGKDVCQSMSQMPYVGELEVGLITLVIVGVLRHRCVEPPDHVYRRRRSARHYPGPPERSPGRGRHQVVVLVHQIGLEFDGCLPEVIDFGGGLHTGDARPPHPKELCTWDMDMPNPAYRTTRPSHLPTRPAPPKKKKRKRGYTPLHGDATMATASQ